MARAESEHLRRAGDEARERGAGADRDRAEAARRAEELRDAVAKLETELASERTKRENAEAATAAAEASAANEASNAEAAAARLADAESVAADAAALRSRLDALRAAHDEQSRTLAEGEPNSPTPRRTRRPRERVFANARRRRTAPPNASPRSRRNSRGARRSFARRPPCDARFTTR